MAAQRKYDWEGWFSQPFTVLVSGIDYHCSQSSMAQMIRNNASRLGVRIRLTDTGDIITIEVIGALLYPNLPPIINQSANALAQVD